MKTKKTQIGIFVITILAITPVVLWYLAPAYPPRFRDFDTVIANLGQLAGLAGIVFLSLNFILATRLKFLEKVFRGLNDVYIKHALIGKIAFVLLLFHPLLLIGKYTSGSLSEIITFLLPGNEWDLNYGIFALVLMLILIVLTLYLRPRYDYWKVTHKFFGLALVFAGLHIWLIPSDVANFLPLRIYILVLVALGIIAYVYKALLGRLIAPKTLMQVGEVKRLSHNVTEIALLPEKNFDYKAGQFIFISFDDKVLGRESHPFSIVSAPAEDAVRIAVKSLGDYTSKVNKLREGTRARVEGPFGIFNYKNVKNKKQIWMAGGIGITPFVSMAEDLHRSNADYDVDLFYAMKNYEDSVYLNRLREIAEKRPEQFRVFPIYFDKHGFLQINKVKETVGDLSNIDIFVCGPPKMMRMVKKDCRNIGVDPDHVHSEEFNL